MDSPKSHHEEEKKQLCAITAFSLTMDSPKSNTFDFDPALLEIKVHLLSVSNTDITECTCISCHCLIL